MQNQHLFIYNLYTIVYVIFIYTYIVITRGLEWVIWHCSDAPKQQTYRYRNIRHLGSVIVSICLPSKQDIKGPIQKAPVICRHEDPVWFVGFTEIASLALRTRMS